ncbi:DUF2207 domain-containing protein [Actinomadura harenae]|uniref:DUF2207 domain-containing protein n=1 Tax=Actinomadura harenae TaxID=2483351 RepID=A0A3M2MAW4_9ACTN|nr:DUF2207 domain-containing protein [Actinomadura harenae]RMI45745.1 DUF2207 domain-containing protein [Actinomadura harenae]
MGRAELRAGGEVPGRSRGAAVAGVFALVLVLLSSAPARAREAPAPRRFAGGGTIPTYDVTMTIRRDGVVDVRETITYDFGSEGGHGFARRVPYRRGERMFDIDDLRTSSSTGAPARVRTLTLPHDLQITVGDDRRIVRGPQAYVIEYEIGRLFAPLPDGRWEMRWDAIGTTWNVPIANAAVRLESPTMHWKTSCRAGHGDVTVPCQRDRDGPYAVDFLQSGLDPHEGMTVRVRLPGNAIAPRPPRYVRPYWDAGWAGTGLLALTVALLPWMLGRPGPAGRLADPVRPVGSKGLARRALTGRILLLAAVLAVLGDAAVDVDRYGLWAVSLGDLTMAGIALGIAGTAALCAQCAPCDGREE